MSPYCLCLMYEDMSPKSFFTPSLGAYCRSYYNSLLKKFFFRKVILFRTSKQLKKKPISLMFPFSELFVILMDSGGRGKRQWVEEEKVVGGGRKGLETTCNPCNLSLPSVNIFGRFRDCQ